MRVRRARRHHHTEARTQTKPDVYPDVPALNWEPVTTESNGLVFIARYRPDPSVEGPHALPDAPAALSPGTKVVFARTTITADQAGPRKMWIGYSDDVVVYLNGHPLYQGRNSMHYRDPLDLGYAYPYADAVYLPLVKGKNELVVSVTETTAGWGILCRFDPR